MLEYCDFEQQVNVKTEEGLATARFCGAAPGGERAWCVDAKTPMNDYLESHDAPGRPDPRQADSKHERRHRRDMIARGRRPMGQFHRNAAPDLVVNLN